MKKRIKCRNSIDKLFLLDAYALIYRAYYALSRTENQFKRIQHFGHSGFVNTLEEVLKKRIPHIE